MIEDPSTIQVAFGQLVRTRRQEAMLSQEELAGRADLDRTYISGVERGTRNPSLVAINRISKGLRITASQLLEGLEHDFGGAR